jgi:hypothetical protein
VAGRLFVDKELFGLFDVLAWHVMGGNSRVLWACNGRFDGGVLRVIPDMFGYEHEVSLFSDELSMRSVLVGVGGCPVSGMSVVVAQESGLCFSFDYLFVAENLAFVIPRARAAALADATRAMLSPMRIAFAPVHDMSAGMLERPRRSARGLASSLRHSSRLMTEP